MKLQLDIKTITTEKKVAQKLLIKIKINGSVEFKTDWASHAKQNIYPFFEKNSITVPEDDLNYIKFQIRNEQRFIIAEKTVLSEQARKREEMQFYVGKQKIKLTYKLIETIPEWQGTVSCKRKSHFEAEPDIMNSKEGRLQISKLGSIVYHFSQRLDPMMWIHNQTEQILSWKSPSLTIGVGIVLTLVIMNLKIAIMIVSLYLTFGKNHLIRRIQKINKKKNVHKRLLVPKQNSVFMQNGMKSYLQLYQKIHQFCLSEDKTEVINFINHLCKFGFILVVLLFIFDIEKLIVLGLWGALLLASPSGVKIFQQLWPSILFFQKHAQKVTQTLNQLVKKAVGNNQQAQQTVIKQFYFYQYQRWILGKGWSKPIGFLQYHFSDQQGNVQLVPKVHPPEGWVWMSNHQIDYIDEADMNGYQFTNDIAKNFSNKSKFATIRRRKFVRKCQLMKNMQAILKMQQPSQKED